MLSEIVLFIWLYERWSVCNDNKFPIKSGIEPMTEHLEMLIVFKFLRPSNEWGKFPPRTIFLVKFRSSRLLLEHWDKPSKKSVIFPLILLYSISNVCRLQTLENEFGIFPTKGFQPKSKMHKLFRCPKPTGIAPISQLDSSLIVESLLIFVNQQGMKEWNWLLERSRTESNVKLMEEIDCGRVTSSQPDRCNSYKRGSILTAWIQSRTFSRFAYHKLRYLREGKLKNHFRLLTSRLAKGIFMMMVNEFELRSRYCSLDKFSRWGGITPENNEKERLKYLKLSREPKNFGILIPLKLFKLRSK